MEHREHFAIVSFLMPQMGTQVWLYTWKFGICVKGRGDLKIALLFDPYLTPF